MHFQVVPSLPQAQTPPSETVLSREIAEKLVPNPTGYSPPGVAQWINCDIRSFDYSVLGQYVPHTTKRDMAKSRFQVIVADPPWDIHMSVRPPSIISPDSYDQLPYGTMTDDEMRQMPIPSLQPDWGILCLWVTGRAMELGRELFQQWGYRRVDELVWVKTSQLGRLIRTGRTGHWLKWVSSSSRSPFSFFHYFPVLSLTFFPIFTSHCRSCHDPQVRRKTDRQPHMRTSPGSSQNPLHSSSKRSNPMGYSPHTPITQEGDRYGCSSR